MDPHFTAWLTNDRSALDGDTCDVVVLADEASSYDIDGDGNETPVWSSTGTPLLAAVTGVDAMDGDPDQAISEAEQLLAAAGWRTTGEWDAVPTGYITTVERADPDEQWTVSEAAEFLGNTSTDTAYKALTRLGVKAVGRAPGRGGQSLYRPAQVMYAHATRPGRGARTDLKDAETIANMEQETSQ